MRSMILAAALMAGTAQAYFVTYAEWERWPENMRYAYIAGSFGMLEDATAPDISRHFSKCVSDTRMNAGQLAPNLRAFVATRPKLQGYTVERAFTAYLVELCGSAPGTGDVSVKTSPMPTGK
jgi:hypothetical protein